MCISPFSRGLEIGMAHNYRSIRLP
nr:photosystem I reaction center subunit XI [Scytonema sp. UIC 10036]